jgi:hypothetical protein
MTPNMVEILKIELATDGSGTWICRVGADALEPQQWGHVLADIVRSLARAKLDDAKAHGESFDDTLFAKQVMANLVGEMVGPTGEIVGPVPNLRIIDGGKDDGGSAP